MARHAAFHETSAKNHLEHESLRRELQALESALAELVCFPEIYANLASAGRVCECGRGLLRHVPGHFAEEEATLLAQLARRSPAAKTFVSEMKRQHLELQRQLDELGKLIEAFQSATDLDDAVCCLKQQGQEFTRRMASHMSAEERKVAMLTVN